MTHDEIKYTSHDDGLIICFSQEREIHPNALKIQILNSILVIGRNFETG